MAHYATPRLSYRYFLLYFTSIIQLFFSKSFQTFETNFVFLFADIFTVFQHSLYYTK